ncbi:SWIM-type domain-containing protein [Abeliophyllum distichum]|uniref:SWIM-type domain-containing protein n=1 Tax=Abeliophyllum distichum TaxID=126358 RepID=A0ABD1VWD4_9LAMI
MKRGAKDLCPKIEIKLLNNIEIAGRNEVDWNRGSQLYVKSRNDEFVIDIYARTCACSRWDLTGNPCGYACAAIMHYRVDLSKYVNDCYKVHTYLNCYENIVMPINGEKLWHIVEKDHIKPLSWIVCKKGRRQKKKRRQIEEIVINQASSTSNIKNKGSVVMTCSVCMLTRHNKRYHEQYDAPHEDWYANIPEDEMQNINDQPQTMSKHQSMRNNKKSSAAPDQQPSPSSFQFMPTLVVGLSKTTVYNKSGSSIDNLDSSRVGKEKAMALTDIIEEDIVM